eukprot:scaffold12352_cov63-Phaeocystis_antarctica.AAC.2
MEELATPVHQDQRRSTVARGVGGGNAGASRPAITTLLFSVARLHTFRCPSSRAVLSCRGGRVAAEPHIAMGDLRFTKKDQAFCAWRGVGGVATLEPRGWNSRRAPANLQVHYKAQGVFSTIESILFRRHGTRVPPPKRCGKLPTLDY